MGLFRRRSREDEIARMDTLTLEALQRNGADLSQPRHVLHSMYFPTREAANSAGDALRADGWIVVVDRARFTALARAGGGEYDGWEASASP